MSRQRVLAGGLAYLVSPDDPVADAERLWAVAIGRVVDEITGAAPRAPIRVTTAEAGLVARVDPDGALCLVARPWLRFPPLAAASHAVTVSVTAAGYLPFSLTVAIPSRQRALMAGAAVGDRVLSLSSVAGLRPGQLVLVGPGGAQAERGLVAALGPAPGQVTLAADLAYPHPAPGPVVADEYAPVDMGALALRRRPVVIRGRTVARTVAGTAAVPFATVSVAGLWPTLADVARHLPAVAAAVVGLKPGVYASRAAGTAVAELAFAEAAGEDKLLRAATDGTARLALSDRVNLVAGNSIVALAPDDVDRRERLLVAGLAPSATPDEPVQASTRVAPRVAHAAGTRVVRVTHGAPIGAGKTLTDGAQPGDQTLFLDAAAFAGNAGALRLGAGPTAEYQAFARYEVVSDGDGYFALPPLHRVAQIAVEAVAAGHPPIDAASNNAIAFQPDYAMPENWLDVVFES